MPKLRVSFLDAGSRFKPGSSVGLSLARAKSGRQNDQLVIATTDAVNAYLVALASGAINAAMVAALI
eukprot:755654-Pyramimonas_sp.AAC.1